MPPGTLADCEWRDVDDWPTRKWSAYLVADRDQILLFDSNSATFRLASTCAAAMAALGLADIVDLARAPPS